MPVMDGYTLLRSLEGPMHGSEPSLRSSTRRPTRNRRTNDWRSASAPMLSSSSPANRMSFWLGSTRFERPARRRCRRCRRAPKIPAARNAAPRIQPDPDSEAGGKDPAASKTAIERLQQDIAAREAVAEQLRNAEEQLRHGQKMEAVGRLAGGIAHDFNNLLTVILSYTTLVLEELSPGERMRDEHLASPPSGRTSDGAHTTAARLQPPAGTSSQGAEFESGAVEMEKMLRRLLGEDIDLSLLTARPVHNVHADLVSSGRS